MRRVLVAGNWKMHKTPSEARVWFRELKRLLPGGGSLLDSEVALLPAFPILPYAREVFGEGPVAYGAQDVSAHREGAYTGEVSARMLKDLGCRYAIVGHSERRRYHHETDTLVREKVLRLLEEGLTPILCVGEPLEVRERGEAVPYTLAQLEAALEGVELAGPERLVVAYEPVWAIGTGKNASPEDAEAMHQEIRQALARRYGEEFAARVRVLYGGSVNPKNFADLLSMPNVDGGLVGGASLELESFLALIKLAG
ncbi:triose-phosphate isomerase [Thermus filiformis]|uniref:Triosephosphate isomerase n=1 Tax=Thermus filiformis TaxID=276 RepID=A0A0A2WLP0_THEFI|nr:triose-phosphate isomerase [Thermus filiformis]KGQ21111.1 triosephosphate isomerase [Thermus filiformis]